MKEIKLSTIIYNEHSHLDGYEPYDKKQIEAIENCIKTGISQALDIASKEATIWVESNINGTEFDKAEFGDEGFKEKVTVHKDSILKVKNRIK